jgi:hypothetical protein
VSGFGAALAGLNLAAKLTGAKAALAKVPPQVWEGLTAAGYALALYLTHQRDVHVHDVAVIAAEDQRIATQALKLKAKIDDITSKITAEERIRNDEQNRRIAADAGAVLMRGPGKASCSVRPGAPAASGGHDAPDRPADAPVAAVPDQERIDLIALPFAPTVGFAKLHDQCLTDLTSYREWGRRIEEAWPKPSSAPNAKDRTAG